MKTEVLCKAGHGGLQQTLYCARHLSKPMAMRVETSLAWGSSLHRLLAFSRQHQQPLSTHLFPIPVLDNITFNQFLDYRQVHSVSTTRPNLNIDIFDNMHSSCPKCGAKVSSGKTCGSCGAVRGQVHAAIPDNAD